MRSAVSVVQCTLSGSVNVNVVAYCVYADEVLRGVVLMSGMCMRAFGKVACA